MINVLINGVNGRMGQEVLKAINASSDFEVGCGIDIMENASDPFPIYTNVNLIKEKIDVIIDFSIPDATMIILEYAMENRIPIVIATTGFSEEQLNKISEYSKIIPIFRSGNMSFEISVMQDLVSKLAKLLKGSDIEIIETHHKNKIDSPSGTALILADSINESFEITHTVTSSSIFANGALKAAKFLVHKENGLYNMKDLI